jgi:Omp85 superfamily domain
VPRNHPKPCPPASRRRGRIATLFHYVFYCALYCLTLPALPLFAQQAAPDSRAGEWQAQRLEKAENLSPEEVSKTEGRLNALRDNHVLERLTQGLAGFRVRLGGLATGQGFAIGPEYSRQEIAHGQVQFRASARAAASGALLFDLQLTLPKLANDHAFVDLYALHQHSPRIDYYGRGPDSEKASRTNFRLETTSYDFTAGVKPIGPLKLGVTGGYLTTNSGPGNREGIASTEQVFGPDTTAALADQPDFLRAGLLAHFDYRDNPGGPRSGGSYLARYAYYDDRTLGLHDFRRLELDAQQYFPFFNKRRVIALRVNTQMSFTSAGQTVPFYLQPTLGGSDDLRGFRSYRFYDDNQIVANAEYRWETFSGLDAALFFDAGKVTPKHSQINFHDLEASAGFGLRFNVRNNVFLRMDVGFSREGTQMWLKFKNPF